MFSITLTIIVITCLVSFAAFNNEKIKSDLLFWPAAIQDQKQYYRFFSYGVIHGDLMHLGFNMLTLYSFGTMVEKYSFASVFENKANLFYLALYLSAIVISTIPDYFKHKNDPSYLALGASGAVSAIIFAGIILNPKIELSIIFLPFLRIPGYVFGILFLVISAYLAKRGRSNIGHGAHFTGAVYGLLFTIIATKVYSGYDAMGIFYHSIMTR
ncbi:MAG: rhomboid family intramembrane serine protease [Chitinophagaceae bacterium]